MNQDEINAIHGRLLDIFLEKDKRPSEIMGFITAIWVGQMALNGYNEEFVDQTLKRMKDSWKLHPLNKTFDKNDS